MHVEETKDVEGEHGSPISSDGSVTSTGRLNQRENEANYFEMDDSIDFNLMEFMEGENPISLFELFGFLLHLLLTLSLMAYWIFAGIFCYVSVIALPIGMQCFKVFYYILLPKTSKHLHLGNATINDLSGINIIIYISWILMFGLGLGFAHLGIAILFYVTVVYEKYAKIHFRAAKFAFFPIGAKIIVNKKVRKSE